MPVRNTELAAMFLRNAWYVAAWADDVTDRPLARRILNEPDVLFRDAQGHPAALLDMCCHRGAPQHLGPVTERGLACGHHGLTFDRTVVEAQQARLSERGETGLVDITSDAAMLHMRRTVDWLLAEETTAIAAR